MGIGEKTRARRRQTRVSRRRRAGSRRTRRSRHAVEGITHRAPGPMLNRRHHGGRATEDVSMKGISPNLRPWIRESTTNGVSETVNGGTKCGVARNRTEEPHRKAARRIRRHSRLPMKGWSGGRGRRGAILLVARSIIVVTSRRDRRRRDSRCNRSRHGRVMMSSMAGGAVKMIGNCWEGPERRSIHRLMMMRRQMRRTTRDGSFIGSGRRSRSR